MEKRDREIQNILNSLPTESVNAVNRLRQMGRHGVPALAVALKYPDPVVRAAAARALARMNDPLGIPALVDALDDADSSVRLAAVLGLSDFPGREAVRALAEALRARHALVRDCAARALACRSLPTLRAALHDPDPVVRAAAAHGVGYYARDRVSIPRLAELLGDANADVRAMAVRALAWVARRHREALPPLTAALQHPDEHVRVAAAHWLGRVGNPLACEALVAALSDPSRAVVLEAIRALGSLDPSVPGGRIGVGDARAIPALLSHLEGPDADLRLAAAEALAHVLAVGPPGEHDPRTLPLLAQALTDQDARVRAMAATALGETGNPEAVPPLTEALNDPVWSVRASAASALGTLGDPSAIPALEAACADPDLAVVSRAELSLQQVRARLR